MPVRELVVPIDFSERCRGAARYAEALARTYGSRVTLLHVLPPPHYEFGAMEVGGAVLEEVFHNRREEAQAQLAQFMAEELPETVAGRELLEGDPAARIVAFAHEREASLIVMPTHGYGTFRRFILGSVTAKVLHDADCPVFTGVHLDEADFHHPLHFKRVAAAIDFNQQCERVVMWAARFAELTGAEVRLLHATPDLEGKAGGYFDPDWRKHVETAVRERAGEVQKRLGTDFTVAVESGEVAHTVCGMAKDAGADLLVIGRAVGEGVLGRLRQHAYAIIRESSCPVVSV